VKLNEFLVLIQIYAKGIEFDFRKRNVMNFLQKCRIIQNKLNEFGIVWMVELDEMNEYI
jgi:hypothetical protein